MSRPAIRHVERGPRHETGERSLSVEFAGLSYLAAWGMGGVTPRPASGQVGESAGVALELPPIQLPPGVPRKVEVVLRSSDENGEAPPGYVDGRV